MTPHSARHLTPLIPIILGFLVVCASALMVVPGFWVFPAICIAFGLFWIGGGTLELLSDGHSAMMREIHRHESEARIPRMDSHPKPLKILRVVRHPGRIEIRIEDDSAIARLQKGDALDRLVNDYLAEYGLPVHVIGDGPLVLYRNPSPLVGKED